MEYITFGRFGREEHWKQDKEVFLTQLKKLISELSKNEELYEKANEIEIAKSLKQILKKPKSDVREPLIILMLHMGLSYDILTRKEKEEIKEMEFTYKNWEKKSEELYNDYYKRSINSCPKEIHFCLFSNDKAELHRAFDAIKTFLDNELKLTFSRHSIRPTKCGINFIGYRYFPRFILMRRRGTAKLTRRILNIAKHDDCSKHAMGQLAAAHGRLKWACSYNFRRSLMRKVQQTHPSRFVNRFIRKHLFRK